MRRRLLLTTITVVFGLGIGLALVEANLRFVGFSNPRTSQRDPYCGTIRRPNLEYFQSDEGAALVRFNSAGFRDEDWKPAKSADTYRIAVLGDSYVEAGQVAHGERFTEVLEQELNGSESVGGRRVHVMTFGVSGFGTAQELMCLRHYVWQYSPDLVLLAFTTGNDVRNNSKALQRDDGRPYFSYANGTLQLDDSFRRSYEPSPWHSAAFAVIDRSRTAQFAYRVWQNRSSILRRARTREAAEAVQGGDEAGLDSWVYAPPDRPVRQEAWTITEALVTTMAKEVGQKGATFVAVTLSNGIQVHPDPQVRRAYMERLGINELFYPEQRLAELGRKHGFAVVNLAPMLLDYASTTGVFLHGFGKGLGKGHWNQNGHREAGRRLAHQLELLLAEADRAAVARAEATGGSR